MVYEYSINTRNEYVLFVPPQTNAPFKTHFKTAPLKKKQQIRHVIHLKTQHHPSRPFHNTANYTDRILKNRANNPSFKNYPIYTTFSTSQLYRIYKKNICKVRARSRMGSSAHNHAGRKTFKFESAPPLKRTGTAEHYARDALTWCCVYLNSTCCVMRLFEYYIRWFQVKYRKR